MVFIVYGPDDRLSAPLLRETVLRLVDELSEHGPTTSPSPGGQFISDDSWEIGTGEEVIDLCITRDATGVYLDARNDLAAQFFCRLRAEIPPDVALAFCEESYTYVYELHSGVTAEDVLVELNGAGG